MNGNRIDGSQPEVYLVRERMLETGVDMFLDIHGDEAIPYNFVAGCEGNPSYDERIAQLENDFKQALLTITPEFQDEVGYDKDEPGKANPTVALTGLANSLNACLTLSRCRLKTISAMPMSCMDGHQIVVLRLATIRWPQFLQWLVNCKEMAEPTYYIGSATWLSHYCSILK